MKEIFIQDFNEAAKTLEAFMSDSSNWDTMEKAGMIMVNALREGKKIISCGNGGSMCDAMHFAEELTGKFRDERKALAAIAISDASHITCAANDYGFENIFARYIEALGNSGDVLLAISTSGSSTNIVNAAQTALNKNMQIIALTGKDGGKLATLAHAEIRAPHTKFSDRCQEIHIKIIHSLIHFIEEHIR